MTIRAIVPAYFQPSDWAAMTAAPAAVAVANVGNPGGPGAAYNAIWAATFAAAKAAGIKVIGYVDLGYATRPYGTPTDTAVSGTILGDINGWVAFYGASIDGIFFDETSSDVSGLAFTTSAVTYARAAIPGAMVVANHGTYPLDSGYVAISDVLCVFEGTSPTYASFAIPGYAAGYVSAASPNKFYHLLYSVPTIADSRAALAICEAIGHAGWFFATDAPAWATLASYWALERTDLAATGGASLLTASVLGQAVLGNTVLAASGSGGGPGLLPAAFVTGGRASGLSADAASTAAGSATAGVSGAPSAAGVAATGPLATSGASALAGATAGLLASSGATSGALGAPSIGAAQPAAASATSSTTHVPMAIAGISSGTSATAAAMRTTRIEGV